MKISEFIKRLQDLYEIDGDLEIKLHRGNDPIGVTPSVYKPVYYGHFVISED